MKTEVKMRQGQIPKQGPFRPGVWLNETECQFIIDRLPKDSWFRQDLIEKFSEAKDEAAKQTASWICEPLTEEKGTGKEQQRAEIHRRPEQ